MPRKNVSLRTMIVLTALFALAAAVSAGDTENGHNKKFLGVQLGPRPFYLVEAMDANRLKMDLEQCDKDPFEKSDFSIGHRGAALQFPEHTRESYIAAARMGAGIIECDVTFTKDRQLVERYLSGLGGGGGAQA